MTHDLKNKVALVTGASRGLGAAMARKLGACGAKVAVNYFGNQQLAQRVVDDIRKQGGTGEIFQADVRDAEQVNCLVAEVQKKFGLIDILVISATGPQPHIPIEQLTWKDFTDQIDFFIKSPLFLMKAVVGQMKQRRYGRIINIGSEVFEKGVPSFSSYV